MVSFQTPRLRHFNHQHRTARAGAGETVAGRVSPLARPAAYPHSTGAGATASRLHGAAGKGAVLEIFPPRPSLPVHFALPGWC